MIKPGRIQLQPPNHAGRPVKTPSETSRVSSSCWCRASRSFSTRAQAQPRCFSYTQPFSRTAECAQVDDLKDIGSLEEYIQHSQVILFFLSCGYFRSKARSRRPAPRWGSSGSQRTRVCCAPRHSPRLTARLLACHQNCLREIRSSLEQSKPIVLVQEADPAKGGTLEELRESCPDELQPDIFDQGRTMTTWYRIEEFQRVSLKTIAEAPRRRPHGWSIAQLMVT